MRALVVSVGLGLAAIAAAAQSAPPLRPMPRPVAEAPEPMRPLPRPSLEKAAGEAMAAKRPVQRPAIAILSTRAPAPGLLRPEARPASALPQNAPVRIVYGPNPERPALRPAHIARIVKNAESQLTPVRFTRKGSICGVKSIKGKAVKPIAGRLSGCGVSSPVRITSVQGVTLSQGATMDCGTAKALDAWVKRGLKPVVKRKGGGVASIKVVAHYACRTRNNRPGAKISEHGKGRAVDIAGFTLKDGTYVSVLKHWRSKAWGGVLKAAHKAACGPFGTVLGPAADRYHQDHFHFDTARYRSGSYCR